MKICLLKISLTETYSIFNSFFFSDRKHYLLLCFVFLTVLLKYNLHTIKFPFISVNSMSFSIELWNHHYNSVLEYDF